MDPQAVFHQAAGGGGSFATGFHSPLAAVDRCVFLSEGGATFHVYAGRDCPKDEEHSTQPPIGWTVQQGAPPNDERHASG